MGAGGQERSGADVPRKVVDFQSDALELANRPLPLLIRLGVWFPLVIVVLAIVWATLAKTDVVVQGGGKLVTDLSTIIMKPLDRSVIKSIDVKIGDVVKKDQVLITFDPEINTAEAERLSNEIAALEAQRERLAAEFNGRRFTCRDEQFSKWQQAIFDQRQKFYGEKMKYYDEAVAQVDASTKNKADNLAKQKERLVHMLEIEKMYEELHKTRAVALKEYLEVQISRMGMEATNDQLDNDILELKHRHGSLIAEKQSFVQDWLNKISEEMVTVDRNLTSTRKQYDKQRQLLGYDCLRAPCNAVVHQIAEFSSGSGVREAEALITLIPIDGDIELEAEIRPEDIGKVKVGADARIKLTAYPFQKHGTLTGVVRNISEDTLDRQVGGMSVKYYRARLAVSGKLRLVRDDFRLIPGMETQCEIKCGRRRVIEYVLYPLIKAMDETAREP